MVSKEMNYQDIYIVEDHDEAEQFRYEHNNEPVEVGTPVAYERVSKEESQMICFEGIYFQEDQ